MHVLSVVWETVTTLKLSAASQLLPVSCSDVFKENTSSCHNRALRINPDLDDWKYPSTVRQSEVVYTYVQTFPHRGRDIPVTSSKRRCPQMKLVLHRSSSDEVGFMLVLTAKNWTVVNFAASHLKCSKFTRIGKYERRQKIASGRGGCCVVLY